MSKVDGSLKSLIQGVSQQPPRTRLPGQSTLQDNFSSNPVDGLTRRPPTQHIADLFRSEITDEAVQFFDYNRDSEKRFIIACTPNSVRAFDLIGNEVPVQEMGTALDYIDGQELAVTTLDKDVYIVNKSKVVTMLNDVPAYINTGHVIFALGGNYGKVYSLTINYVEGGVNKTQTVSYTTPTGAVGTDINLISTTNIITQLQTAFVANSTLNTVFDTTLISDVLYIVRKPAAVTVDEKFNIQTSDGANGTYLFAVGRQVTDTAKLPRFAPQGFVIRITGSGQGSQDDWYVRYSIPVADNGVAYPLGEGFGVKGLWVECSAPGLKYKIDTATMPHVLTYDPVVDEFTFTEGDWAGRQVGDEDSNANPSFIDKQINDVGAFQGRLCVLSGDAIVMSRTNKPLDFWVQSATTSADSDAIDISSTAVGSGAMYRMVPYNRDLVIFADGGQFIVSGRTALTPMNASLVLTTSFEAAISSSPAASGRNIFFAINYGNFTGIREYYTDGNAEVNDSRVITQHVSKYIKGKSARLTTSSNFEILLVQTKTDNNFLYAYEYLWQDDAKAQSSWSRWIFNSEIVYSFMIEAVIYLVFRRNGLYTLEKIDMNVQPDNGITYNARLDDKKIFTNVNFTIPKPYEEMPDFDRLVFVQGEGCPTPGLRVNTVSYDGTTITFTDDMLGGDVIVGQRFRSSYKPTMPDVKDADGIKIDSGKLIVKQFIVNYRDSGDMNASVTSKYRDEALVYYSGRIVGDPNNLVGVATIQDGRFVVPFRDNIDYSELELYTESHLPLTMMDISWSGQYTKRGTRISRGGN